MQFSLHFVGQKSSHASMKVIFIILLFALRLPAQSTPDPLKCCDINTCGPATITPGPMAGEEEPRPKWELAWLFTGTSKTLLFGLSGCFGITVASIFVLLSLSRARHTYRKR